jgi:hypothetical protein
LFCGRWEVQVKLTSNFSNDDDDDEAGGGRGTTLPTLGPPIETTILPTLGLPIETTIRDVYVDFAPSLPVHDSSNVQYQSTLIVLEWVVVGVFKSEAAGVVVVVDSRPLCSRFCFALFWSRVLDSNLLPIYQTECFE